MYPKVLCLLLSFSAILIYAQYSQLPACWGPERDRAHQSWLLECPACRWTWSAWSNTAALWTLLYLWQLLLFNKEFLVSMSHQLALIKIWMLLFLFFSCTFLPLFPITSVLNCSDHVLTFHGCVIWPYTTSCLLGPLSQTQRKTLTNGVATLVRGN